MITPTKAYKTSNGKTFDCLEEAQMEELAVIISGVPIGNPFTNADMKSICQQLVQVSDKVVDILTTKPGSKVRARAVNGGKKKRKPDDAVNRALQDGKQ